MPKRPKERGVAYDRNGRPLEGITTTETLSEQTGAEVQEEEATPTVPDVDGDDE